MVTRQCTKSSIGLLMIRISSNDRYLQENDCDPTDVRKMLDIEALSFLISLWFGFLVGHMSDENGILWVFFLVFFIHV